eukprot:4803668-Amphidinium_carterae.1
MVDSAGGACQWRDGSAAALTCQGCIMVVDVMQVEVVLRSGGWTRCDCHMIHGVTSVRQRCSCGKLESAVEVLFNWEVDRIITDLASERCCSDVVVEVNVDSDCGTLWV